MKSKPNEREVRIANGLRAEVVARMTEKKLNIYDSRLSARVYEEAINFLVAHRDEKTLNEFERNIESTAKVITEAFVKFPTKTVDANDLYTKTRIALDVPLVGQAWRYGTTKLHRGNEIIPDYQTHKDAMIRDIKLALRGGCPTTLKDNAEEKEHHGRASRSATPRAAAAAAEEPRSTDRTPLLAERQRGSRGSGDRTP